MVDIEKCSPGNECAKTIENNMEIKHVKQDQTEVKQDIKDIRNKIDYILFGSVAYIITTLIKWLWEMAKVGNASASVINK